MASWLVVAWLLLAMAAGMYAKRINRSATLWALFALALSPLVAFVFLLALGPKESESLDRVPCPVCSEAVLISAIRCPHCRSDL
jgi:hypothetical protein